MREGAFREKRLPVALLGATGLVGQKAIALLEGHPRLYLSELVASDQKAGQLFGDAVSWREAGELPKELACLRLKAARDVESGYILSALPAEAARQIEPLLAAQGALIFSNASAFRLRPDVPNLIPEVNLEHLSLLDKQKTSGKIVTNPNCTAVFVALALAPLFQLGELEQVSAVTMQAVSGAGYPGVDSMDILGNLLPYIPGEEEKIAQETKKILGSAERQASFGITVHAHRVPVLHGHTIALHLHFSRAVDPEQARKAYLDRNRRWPGLYKLYEEPSRPQPLRDLGPYDSSVHIGRIKRGAKAEILGLIAMGNNLVRGAAGASIRNLEAFLERQGEA